MVRSKPASKVVKKCNCFYNKDGSILGMCNRCAWMIIDEYNKGYNKGQKDAKKGFNKND